MRYEAMATWLRARMQVVEIRTGRELIARLAAVKCSVHENMVSRWMTGRGRPQGHRLEALLDVLGVVKEPDRDEVRRLAYMPPALQSPNRLSEDDIPTEFMERGA